MAKRTKRAAIPKEIEFDLIKSNYFRVIKADGAFGGITGNGAIHMALYNERNAIPTKMVHAVIGGGLGPELIEKRVARNAVVREVEVDVTMEINQAIALRNWLDDKIKRYGELVGAPETASTDSMQNITKR